MVSLAAIDQPRPVIARTGRRLQRAVLLFVVLGTIGLLSYASWQRVANARELPAPAAPLR